MEPRRLMVVFPLDYAMKGVLEAGIHIKVKGNVIGGCKLNVRTSSMRDILTNALMSCVKNVVLTARMDVRLRRSKRATHVVCVWIHRTGVVLARFDTIEDTVGL